MSATKVSNDDNSRKPVPNPNVDDNSSNTEKEKEEIVGGQKVQKGPINTIHPIRDFLGKDDNVNRTRNAIDNDVTSKWAFDAFPFEGVVDLGPPPKQIDYIRIASENEQPNVTLDFSNDNTITGYGEKQKVTLKKGVNVIKTRKNLVARYIRIHFEGNKALDEDKNQKPDPVGIFYIQAGQGDETKAPLPAPAPLPTPPPEPEPEPPAPVEGRIKNWGGDITKGAKSWKIVRMRDNAKLYKVTDAKGTNIADLFSTPERAQGFIDYHIFKQGVDAGPDVDPNPEPGPGPTPNPGPGGEGVTKDGVKIPYETTGKMEYTFKHNDRDDGKRMDFNNLKAGEYVNAAVIGYFAFPKDNAPDDEVSGKFSAMSHSGSNRTECFDMGMGIKDGATRIRYEARHPEYTGDLGKGEKGLPLKTKFIGYMFVRKDLPNGNVLCEQWQDQGDNEGSAPANKWVKLFSWQDPKYQFKDYKDGHTVTIRVDGSNVVKDMKLKWLCLVELKA